MPTSASKKPMGRPAHTPGKPKVKMAFSLSQKVAAWLNKQPNRSAAVEAAVEKEMKNDKEF